MDLVREKGMFSFYEDGHGECCRIRKVRFCAVLLLCASVTSLAVMLHRPSSSHGECCRIRKVGRLAGGVST